MIKAPVEMIVCVMAGGFFGAAVCLKVQAAVSSTPKKKAIQSSKFWCILDALSIMPIAATPNWTTFTLPSSD